MTLFAIVVLAVWRATLMIAEGEEGPFSILAWARGHLDPYQKTWLGRGLNCLWCVSWWAGCVAAVWLWYFGYLAAEMIPLWWFGSSAGAIFLQNIVTRRR